MEIRRLTVDDLENFHISPNGFNNNSVIAFDDAKELIGYIIIRDEPISSVISDYAESTNDEYLLHFCKCTSNRIDKVYKKDYVIFEHMLNYMLDNYDKTTELLWVKTLSTESVFLNEDLGFWNLEHNKFHSLRVYDLYSLKNE